jgi:hypothetical protein
MSLKSLEMPHIIGKASHHFKKASISLKMPSKRMESFTKTSISLKIALKCHEKIKKPGILKK